MSESWRLCFFVADFLFFPFVVQACCGRAAMAERMAVPWAIEACSTVLALSVNEGRDSSRREMSCSEILERFPISKRKLEITVKMKEEKSREKRITKFLLQFFQVFRAYLQIFRLGKVCRDLFFLCFSAKCSSYRFPFFCIRCEFHAASNSITSHQQ